MDARFDKRVFACPPSPSHLHPFCFTACASAATPWTETLPITCCSSLSTWELGVCVFLFSFVLPTTGSEALLSLTHRPLVVQFIFPFPKPPAVTNPTERSWMGKGGGWGGVECSIFSLAFRRLCPVCLWVLSPAVRKKKKRSACWGVLEEKTLFVTGRTKIQWGWSVLLGCTPFLVNLLMAVVRWQSLGTRNGGVRLFAWCVDATSIKSVVTFGREEELSGSHFAALKIKFCPTLFSPARQFICAAGPSYHGWLGISLFYVHPPENNLGEWESWLETFILRTAPQRLLERSRLTEDVTRQKGSTYSGMTLRRPGGRSSLRFMMTACFLCIVRHFWQEQSFFSWILPHCLRTGIVQYFGNWTFWKTEVPFPRSSKSVEKWHVLRNVLKSVYFMAMANRQPAEVGFERGRRPPQRPDNGR